MTESRWRTAPRTLIVRLILCVITLTLCACLGCAFRGDNPGTRRSGSLSDAAEEASKAPEDQEPMTSYDVDDDDDDDYDDLGGHSVTMIDRQTHDLGQDDARASAGSVTDTVSTDGGTTHGMRAVELDEPEKNFPLHIGFTGGVGTQAGSRFDAIGVGGIHIGTYHEDQFRGDFALVFTEPQISGFQQLDRAIGDAGTLAFDGSGRFYFTRGHTFIGPYVLAGLRFGWFYWEWKNPIEVDGEEISSDDLYFGAIYAGLGASIIQTRHFHVGGNLAFGLMIYDSLTGEGFENDLFYDAGFTQLVLDFTIRF